jgi:pimeloyl-ACP methyl ester carboxylesterase
MHTRDGGEPQEHADTATPLEGIGDLGPLIAPIEPIDDPRVGIGRDFGSESSTMLVIFAAMGTRPPPPFHFFQVTTGMPAKRLFARDPHRVWYHRGVPGFGDSIDEVATSLRGIVEEQGAERVIALGSSAGGFAALVFGTLLEADLVLCFAPQTVLDPDWLADIGDRRWNRRLRALDALGGPDTRYVDVREAIMRDRRADTAYEVHYPASHDWDVHHARHLEGIPGLELHAHQEKEHQFVQALNRSGELWQMLRAAVGG